MTDEVDKKNSALASVSTDPDCSKDATIAQYFHAMQQLTSIFQFSESEAQAAIEAVGTDVTTAYNYILDNGGNDKGGAIIPIDDCPHLVYLGLDANQMEFDNVCTYYEDEGGPKGGLKGEIIDGKCPSGENWLCLTCGVVRCSRYVNGHCKEHCENMKNRDGGQGIQHCVAASLQDLSVWCYECEAYLNHPSLSPILKRLEEKKFSGDTE